MYLHKLLLLGLFLSMTVSLSGQEKVYNTEVKAFDHGYRAFVEINGIYNLAGFDFSTTHGYQFNSNLYAGAGVSYGAVIGGYYSYAHADIRCDYVYKDKITPFADLRISFNKSGALLQPAIGYRYKRLNVSARYWLNKYDDIMTFGVGFDFGGRKKR